jgi:hypothetical protein
MLNKIKELTQRIQELEQFNQVQYLLIQQLQKELNESKDKEKHLESLLFSRAYLIENK